MRACLALLLCLSLSARAEEVVDTVHGFRMAGPTAEWRSIETPPPPECTFAYKLTRAVSMEEVSVTLYLADVEGYTDAKGACDLAEARWKADPHVSGIQRAKGSLAGTDAPSLRFVYTLGERYVIRQQYLVQGDTLYALQSLAPEAEFERDLRDFDAVVATFAFVPIADPKRHAMDHLVRGLSRRCGSEIAWARSWEEASARARKEDKLVVVVVELYQGFQFQRYAPSTTFMDSDVVELMNERFVGLQWSAGMKAPFQSPDLYGMGPSTFGQGILFVDANGRVVGEAVSFNPYYFYQCAREVLAAHPGAPPKNPHDIQELLRRGDLDAAWTKLKDPDTAFRWKQKADLQRRLRLGDEARKALESARREGEGVDLDEAVIDLRTGRYAEAEALLQGREDPESRYWRACSKGMRQGIGAIRAELESLADDHPESRWAWRGAAMLCNLGLMTGEDRLEWPDEKSLSLAQQPSHSPTRDVDDAREGAVKFLLGSQLGDGSWSSPVSLVDAQSSVPLAVTSICGMALLPFRARPEVAQSLDRALACVLRGNFATGQARLFDYTVWGQVFSLRFLASCAKEGVGDRARLVAVMNAIVKEMRADQRSGGGWAYVRFTTTGSPEGNSIGFVTAAAVLALLDAKDAGAEVPDGMLAKAVEALAPLARGDGSFGYMQVTGRLGSPAESSLRSPLYALALRRAGKGNGSEVTRALQLYLAHHNPVRAERGKALCHTSPEGVASYYLLFGYAFSAEALRDLPEEEGGRYREALLEDVLTMRDEDGSFCDNPMIGRCYGTAAALRALGLLGEGR